VVFCGERRVVVRQQPVAVGARAFDLLVALIERRDRVVGKDELLAVVWPGLVVEEANIQVQISALRKLIGPEALATVTGRGYRFSAVLLEPAAEASVALGPGRTEESDLSLPDKPSIAVLDFANLSSDPEHRFFADGVTQDIVNALSRFHSLFVIAHASTATYSDATADIGTVANQLGVRYVVAGSVRRAGNRVRVTAQLIDASLRRHIWSENYDRVLEEIFDIQDELTQMIATAVAPEIAMAEIAKAQRPRRAKLSAYEIALQAWAQAWRCYRSSDMSSIEHVLDQAGQALEIDPSTTLALNAIAFAHAQRVFFRDIDNLEDAWERGMRAARQAIALDASDSLGYVIKANLLAHDPRDEGRSIRYGEALDDLRTAHQLNPNDHFALRLLGLTEAVSGDPVRGIAHLQQALRLNPRDPFSVNVVAMLALAHFFARNYEEGIRCAQRAIAASPGTVSSFVFLAMNYVGIGEVEKAKTACAAGRRLSPSYVDARVNGYCVYAPHDYRLRQRVFLRIAAGLEDPASANALR
jgi:TolB-like protein